MRVMFLVGLGVLAGCGIAPLSTAASAITADECDVTRCGTNSPVIDSVGFHELNVDGLENAQHLRLVGLEHHGVMYRTRVSHGRLSGFNSAAAPPVIAGPALTGAQLVVRAPGGALISITIASVGTVHYWAALPGAPHGMTPPIETYDLRWAPFHVTQGQPVCGNPARSDDQFDTLGMIARTAVVFEGDRIDADGKTVALTAESGWFNIGCAGHAIAKLALTGHTEAARADGYQTDLKERQAMLKMFTGDYCGTGEAFTAPGEKLYWRDHRGWMSFLGPVHPVVEARWTSAGAACLGAPRLDVNAPVSGWPAMLGMPAIAQIRAACPTLPLCADLDPTHQGGAHLVTGNPL
jgi:hypothetical protein